MQHLHHKIYNYFEAANHILLICHRRPDGDALGSICALMDYLDNISKSYQSFCIDLAPRNLTFIPGVEKIKNANGEGMHFLNIEEHDLIVVLDCGDLRQTGLEEDIIKKRGLIPLINIDHHFTNKNFGDINLVDRESAATSEIIYDFFQINNVAINKSVATCLLTGILTDTDNFSNPGTRLASLKIASQLLIRGANFTQIIDYTLRNKSFKTLKLWGKVLSRLNRNSELGIVSTIITQDDLKDFVSAEEVTEGIASFLNSLSGAKAVMVLKELKGGEIKGSLRTTNPTVNISELATLLGGGGHKKAAGFTIHGHLEERQGKWEVV